MGRSRRPSPGAWALAAAVAVAVVGGLVSPVPVRSQIPRLEARAAPSPIPPDEPWDEVWASAPGRHVPLSAQDVSPPFGGGGTRSLTVRAMHEDDRLFILLEWFDDDVDDAVVGVELFSDAAAVQFPARAGDEPPYTMGSANHPVSIWQWKAVWQADIDRGFAASRHPNTAVDAYPNADDPLYNPARYVGNQLADSAHFSPIESLIAEGFGTLTFAGVQDVSGVGSWRNGAWRVLFIRSFASEGEMTTFAVGRDTPIAFAVWDGGAGDRNGQKSIAPYISLGVSKEVASVAPPGDGGTGNRRMIWALTAILVLLMIVLAGSLLRDWVKRSFDVDG